MRYLPSRTGELVADGTDDEKPKAGGYALVDWRLSRIEAQLGENAKNAVPIGIYNVNQENITAKLAELQKADATETAARTAGDTALQAKFDGYEERQNQTRADLEKARKQFWATLAGGALLLILQLVGNPLGAAIANVLVGQK